MGDTEKGNIDLSRRLQTPPFATNYQLQANTNNNYLDVSQLNLSQIQGSMRQNLQNSPSFGSENMRRVAGFPPSHPQMPPISPYSQLPVNRSSNQHMGLHNFVPGPCHSRSLSQPSIFNSDSLPPLAPPAYKDGITSPRSGENHEGGSDSMLSPSPPCGVGARKSHRRSMSDVPFGYSNGLFQSPPPLPPGGDLQRTLSGRECAASSKPAQLVKKESCWEETKADGEAMDDLLAAYMNLDSIDVLNSGGANKRSDAENRDEMDSGASNSKTRGGDSSDNDAESSISEGGSSGKSGISPVERKEGLKRSAVGDIAPTIRHQRSISMDSFMGKLQLSDDPTNLPPAAAGALAGQLESSKALGFEFRNGEFSGAEMKKIMANEKLAEIAMSDPKRAKRILANRQSAARSKERKMRYISELEHKVQTLQNEATTLSAQLTMLQKDSEGLSTLNNELKFRLQAMEQQARLRDALNDALTKEIQRLRIATGELAEPRARGTEPFGFNCQEPTSSSSKSESNSSRE